MRIMYHIVYGLLWLVSILPLRVLYLIGDFFYLLIFYVFRYRRDIVYQNLAIAFPEKSEKERHSIARKFYHNLIDTFIETIKMISVSKKWLEKRVKGNWEVINDLYSTGRSVQVHMGHNFNWEWANAVAANKMVYKFLGVYMPISNQIFDRLFRNLRSRYGTILLRATHMSEDILPYRTDQYLLGLVADQNPGRPAVAWWFKFFGKPAPFVKGPAKAAVINDAIVVYAFIHKSRRGYYEIVFSLAEMDAKNRKEEDLTEEFVTYLEGVIRQYPDMWLWSHRRWKWEYKEEYGKILNGNS